LIIAYLFFKFFKFIYTGGADRILRDIELEEAGEIQKMNDLKKAHKAYLDQDKLDRMSYKQYLVSEEWNLIKKRIHKRDKHTCQICGAKRTHENKTQFGVHHKHYENIKREKDEDLILLCNSCHAEVHIIQTNDGIPNVFDPKLPKEVMEKVKEDCLSKLIKD
jgi:hypothetical protein